MTDQYVAKIKALEERIAHVDAKIEPLQKQIWNLEEERRNLRALIRATREDARESIGLGHKMTDEQLVSSMRHYFGDAAILEAAENIEHPQDCME